MADELRERIGYLKFVIERMIENQRSYYQKLLPMIAGKINNSLKRFKLL